MWSVFQQAMCPYTRPESVTRTLVGPVRFGLVNHSEGGSSGAPEATFSAQVVASGAMPAAAVRFATCSSCGAGAGSVVVQSDVALAGVATRSTSSGSGGEDDS